jgi:hypothetical protein
LEHRLEAGAAEIAQLKAEMALMDPYASAKTWAERENRHAGSGSQQGAATFSASAGAGGDDAVYESAAAFARRANEVDARRGRHARL